MAVHLMLHIVQLVNYNYTLYVFLFVWGLKRRKNVSCWETGLHNLGFCLFSIWFSPPSFFGLYVITYNQPHAWLICDKSFSLNIHVASNQLCRHILSPHTGRGFRTGNPPVPNKCDVCSVAATWQPEDVRHLEKGLHAPVKTEFI